MSKKYEEGFEIENFEGTKLAFQLLLDKLLSPLKPQDYVKVKMKLEFRKVVEDE